MLVSYYNVVKIFPVIQNKLCNRAYYFLIQVKLLELLISFKCLLRNILFFISFILIAFKKSGYEILESRALIFNYFQNLITLVIGVFLITLNLIYSVSSLVNFMSNLLCVVICFQC